MKTDPMLARGMGGEGESAFRAILPGQDNFILWVFNLHEHAKPRGGRLVLLSLLVIQLRPVVSYNHGLVRNFLNKALFFRLPNVEVQRASAGRKPQQ